jgi:hypothetical protein
VASERSANIGPRGIDRTTVALCFTVFAPLAGRFVEFGDIENLTTERTRPAASSDTGGFLGNKRLGGPGTAGDARLEFCLGGHDYRSVGGMHKQIEQFLLMHFPFFRDVRQRFSCSWLLMRGLAHLNGMLRLSPPAGRSAPSVIRSPR